MNTCYVYKWTHLPTMKWYVGSRTAKNSNPSDGYICSSRLVKPLILANQQDWKREVIDIGSANDMRQLESDILNLFDAKNDPQSFNQHNCDGKFNTTGVPSLLKGRIRPQNEREKISKSLKQYYSTNNHHLTGIPKSDDFKNRMSMCHKGKKRTEHQKKAISNARIEKGTSSGRNNGNFKGEIVATNILSNETQKFIGNKALNIAGFNPGSVSVAIRFNRVYKNNTWTRIE